jgi:hypothetical protein
LILSAFPDIFSGRSLMAESTPLRDHALPEARTHEKAQPLGGAGRKIKLAFVRTAFWSYERGTWQYDLIVLAILAFIFLTPRAWFQDRPTLQLTDLRHIQGVVEVSQGKEGRSYLLDARLVESLAPQKAEDAIREILRARIQKPFTIKSLDTIRDRNNVVLGYTVVVVVQ